MLVSTDSVLRVCIAAMALTLLLGACADRPQDPATVSGTAVTSEQLQRTANVFTAITTLQQQTCGQTDGPTDTQEAACNRFSLGALVQFVLADTYAAANGVTLDARTIDETLGAFEQNIGKDTLATQLAASGVTLEDVRELVRLSLVQDAVAKAVTAERLGDEELRRRYQRAIADYTTLHVDQILVDTKAQARQIYEQATAPGFTLADFQALARQVSTDPNASQDGGELTVPASQTVAEFSDAALRLQPGEISEPVQTQYGWHVIWMIDTQVTPFAEARDQILQTAQAEVFGAWVREQDAAGAIDVDPKFGRFDPDQLTIVRITSTDPDASEPTPSGAVNGVSPSP